jgi:hypothetical protein
MARGIAREDAPAIQGMIEGQLQLEASSMRDVAYWHLCDVPTGSANVCLSE